VIRAWRLTRGIHAAPPSDAFNGVGAERRGGRWNAIGTRAAYASSSRSLAALEYLANVDPEDLPDDLVYVGISFDEAYCEIANPPDGWDTLDSVVAIRYGEAWLASRRSAVLAVPSVIVPAERNYVVNPAHGDFVSIDIADEVETFVFDARLLRRQE
jgi:RES domain-containing protein